MAQINDAIAQCPCFFALTIPNQIRYPVWGQESGYLMHRHCRLLTQK